MPRRDFRYLVSQQAPQRGQVQRKKTGRSRLGMVRGAPASLAWWLASAIWVVIVRR